jgi:ribosomal protein L11 methylase PrmA
MSRNALLGLLDSLEAGVRRLDWRPGGTEWSDYYDNTNYDAAAFDAKKRLVARLLEMARCATASPPGRVCDLGANTGVFSRVASEQGIFTLALDVDPAAVEKNYRACRASGEQNLLPLVQDLTNPSAGVGWAGEERPSFFARWTEGENQNGDGGNSVAFALALVHHLAIGNNVPFAHIARLLSRLAEHLLIEWVPKEDSQARRLLARRAANAFPDYTPAGFEAAFGAHFTIRERAPIPGTSRTLYLMRRHRGDAVGAGQP